jgi:RecG-like helicase
MKAEEKALRERSASSRTPDYGTTTVIEVGVNVPNAGAGW